MMAPGFQLTRNALGRLVLTHADGEIHADVVPVRAFPIAAPESGIALMNPEGHEVAWIAHLDQLPPPLRQLIDEELACREFVPEIRAIHSVSSFATPSTWQVETDRGEASLALKGEEDIRRLSQTMLLIADANGIQFLVRDLHSLDKTSRNILDRFL